MDQKINDTEVIDILIKMVKDNPNDMDLGYLVRIFMTQFK